MIRYSLAAAALALFPSIASAQSFVSECTSDHVGGEEVLCQTNGVYGTCIEVGPNMCENPDGCEAIAECAIAYCVDSAVRGDSCSVAGELGGCIPLCEVDFSVDCGAGGADLVCEVGSSGMFDEGDVINCSSTGSPANGFSLFALLAAGIFLRRRRR